MAREEKVSKVVARLKKLQQRHCIVVVGADDPVEYEVPILQSYPAPKSAVEKWERIVHLRPRNLAELTGRREYVIWHRLRTLVPSRTVRFGPNKGDTVVGRGYVNYVIESADSLRSDERRETAFDVERVYFLTQKGWNKALDLGFIKFPVNAVNEKSNQNLDHDLKLTDIHLALWRKWRDRLHWYQYRPFTYHRFGKGDDELINADAFYWIDKDDRFRRGSWS